MLGKPVIITDYATASAQLENGKDGLIVPMSNAGCAEGIRSLALDREWQLRLSGECLSRDYSNADQADKLLRIIMPADE